MTYVMFTIQLKDDIPSIESAAIILGVPVSVFDQQFGLVLIDPVHSQYAILIDEGYASNVHHNPRIKGPFSNPRIGTITPEMQVRIEEGMQNWNDSDSEVRKRFEAAKKEWDEKMKPHQDMLEASERITEKDLSLRITIIEKGK